MMRSYTELDLLRFIYKEVEICEYFEMDFAIKEDLKLREEYSALKRSLDAMPDANFQPRNASVQNILGYAAV